MSLHLAQYRSLHLSSGEVPREYPRQVIVTVTLGPEDAFGLNCKPRTTVRRAEHIDAQFDPGEGSAFLRGDLIDAVDTAIGVGRLDAHFKGNVLTIRYEVDSLDDAENFARAVSHVLPPTLSLHLGTFVWVKDFWLDLGTAKYRFVALEMRPLAVLATRKEQEQRLASALTHFGKVVEDPTGRLVSALCYYRHALRLEALMPCNEEFAAEVLLNLSKAIEIIFSNNRDRLRAQAEQWGFSQQDVERRIVPLLLIRNEMDVAHVATGLLRRKERDTFLDFVGTAVHAVRDVLEKVLGDVESGAVVLKPCGERVKKDKTELLEHIREYMRDRAERQEPEGGHEARPESRVRRTGED